MKVSVNLQTKGQVGIFQAFDMKILFDKEGLIDTLHTMNKKGKISVKDYTYRMWFKQQNMHLQLVKQTQPPYIMA